MNPSKRIVFLFDIDNTLLDNDRVIIDLKRHMTSRFGPAENARYWEIFEQLRNEVGYADYLGALQSYRTKNLREPGLLSISLFLTNYPFANRLFPGSLDAIEHCRKFGETVILSDGDVVFQPRKIERSGIYEAVEQRVLIYIHKEQMLDDVERRFPADHYVMVEDKIRILDAMKKIWGKRLTTIFVKQGHYAHDEKLVAQYPPADIAIKHIGDLPGHGIEEILAAAH